MLSRRHLLMGLCGAAAAATFAAPVEAAMTGLPAPLPKSSTMSAGKLIPAPSAWFSLLRRHPDLDPAAARFGPLKLSLGRAAQLAKVNKEINARIQFRDDTGQDFWEIGDRAGDCEDYAIRKLQTLIRQHSFPRGALTLAACRLDRGRGHAVLLVHSDRGVYVLDNLTHRVMPWRDLPYRWVAREEPGSPFRLWRSLAA
ncbi:transglutaminase-like cysteine peptidase [Pelagibius sp. CAU 1746]|uniref:transglutaminase-like cysteine peptidase n=1 Tax=Pelagibius sp. CAU 1746 TaxID=3140370 RepID=UPI00325B3E60